MASKIKEAQGHLQAAHEALQRHFSDEKHPYASHLAHVQNNIDAALSHLGYVAQNEPDEVEEKKPDEYEVSTGPDEEEKKPNVRKH